MATSFVPGPHHSMDHARVTCISICFRRLVCSTSTSSDTVVFAPPHTELHSHLNNRILSSLLGYLPRLHGRHRPWVCLRVKSEWGQLAAFVASSRGTPPSILDLLTGRAGPIGGCGLWRRVPMVIRHLVLCRQCPHMT